jgi:hypothetical protein
MLICCVIRNWLTVCNIALKFAVIQPSALNVPGKKNTFSKKSRPARIYPNYETSEISYFEN